MEEARKFFLVHCKREVLPIHLDEVHEWRTQVKGRGNWPDQPVGSEGREACEAGEGWGVWVGRVKDGMTDTIGVWVQARLAVTGLSKWGGCRLGLFEEGSHRVSPIPSTSTPSHAALLPLKAGPWWLLPACCIMVMVADSPFSVSFHWYLGGRLSCPSPQH